MKFPKRTNTHIMESSSWKIYQSRTPSEWIIREVTERDYGIDSYIEIIENDGNLTGKLCSIQLKSAELIHWKEDRALLKGIKKSTVNYWMGLPVPVFIFWVDIGQGKIYFCSVENQIREKYSEFINEDTETISFEFFKFFEIGTELGNAAFKTYYYQQRNYPVFANNLKDLIFHYEEYNAHILENLGRDCFLFVDEREFFLSLHIYIICLTLSEFLRIKWTATKLDDLLKDDRNTWKNKFCPTIHELTHDKLLREIYPLFSKIITKCVDIVTKQQKDYWEVNEYLVLRVCDEINLSLLEPDII